VYASGLRDRRGAEMRCWIEVDDDVVGGLGMVVNRQKISLTVSRSCEVYNFSASSPAGSAPGRVG
jgi:hypothetical protein